MKTAACSLGVGYATLFTKRDLLLQSHRYEGDRREVAQRNETKQLQSVVPEARRELVQTAIRMLFRRSSGSSAACTTRRTPTGAQCQAPVLRGYFGLCDPDRKGFAAMVERFMNRGAMHVLGDLVAAPLRPRRSETL